MIPQIHNRYMEISFTQLDLSTQEAIAKRIADALCSPMSSAEDREEAFERILDTLITADENIFDLDIQEIMEEGDFYQRTNYLSQKKRNNF